MSLLRHSTCWGSADDNIPVQPRLVDLSDDEVLGLVGSGINATVSEVYHQKYEIKSQDGSASWWRRGRSRGVL